MTFITHLRHVPQSVRPRLKELIARNLYRFTSEEDKEELFSIYNAYINTSINPVKPSCARDCGKVLHFTGEYYKIRNEW